MELIKNEQVFNRDFLKEGAFYKLTHKPSGKTCMATIKFLSDGTMQMNQGGYGKCLTITTHTPQSFVEFLKEEELEIKLFKEEHEVYDILQKYEKQNIFDVDDDVKTEEEKHQKSNFFKINYVDNFKEREKLINIGMISSIEYYEKGVYKINVLGDKDENLVSEKNLKEITKALRDIELNK